jgi:hypothetical protein
VGWPVSAFDVLTPTRQVQERSKGPIIKITALVTKSLQSLNGAALSHTLRIPVAYKSVHDVYIDSAVVIDSNDISTNIGGHA